MTIDAFLKTTGWTEKHLGLLCKPPVRQHTINRLRRRERKASLDVALGIERATEGRVGADEVPLSKRTRRALDQLRPGTAA